jgi:hypothetical protein
MAAHSTTTPKPANATHNAHGIGKMPTLRACHANQHNTANAIALSSPELRATTAENFSACMAINMAKAGINGNK